MGVSLGLALSRTIVIAFNFIFFALGGLSLGLGIYSYFYGAIGNFISIPPFSIGLMVIGGVALLVTFLGCFGAAKESRGMLGCYFFFLVLLVVTSVAIGYLAVSKISVVDDLVQSAWATMSSGDKEKIYEQFHCCGYTVPDNATCHDEIKQDPNITGCQSVLTSALSGKLQIVEITGIVLAAFIIVGLIFTCCIYCAIPSSKEKQAKEKLDEKQRLINAAFNINKQNYTRV